MHDIMRPPYRAGRVRPHVVHVRVCARQAEAERDQGFSAGGIQETKVGRKERTRVPVS